MLNQNTIHDLLSTRKIRKFKQHSIKNAADHQAILSRISYNGIKIDYVTEILESTYGGKFKVDDLLKFARLISSKLNIAVDRLAARNRAALICWFSENWSLIYPHIQYFHSFKGDFPVHEKSQYQQNHCISSDFDPSDLSQLLNYH